MKAEEMALLWALADEWDEVAEKQCAFAKKHDDKGGLGFGRALALSAEHLRTCLDGMCAEVEAER